MSRHRALLAVFVFALTVILIGWMTRTADDSSGAIPSETPADIADEPPARRAQARNRPSPTAPDEARPTDPAEPDGSPLFPELVVVVQDSDGVPVREGRVWASRSADFPTNLRVAEAELDDEDEGSCRLRLPRTGVYDVTVWDGGLLGQMESGIDTSTTSSVTVRLPAATELRFVRASEESPLQGTATIRLARRYRWGREIWETDGAPWMFGGVERTIALCDLPVTLRTVPGIRFEYCRGVDPSIAAPDVFTAPATVTIGRPKWGSYLLLVSVEPADRTASRESFVSWDFEIEGGGRTDDWGSGGMTIPAGARVSDVVRFTLQQSPPARHSIVKWSGRGFHEGSAAIDVGESGVVDVPVVLRLDDGPLPTSELVACVDAPTGTRAEVWIVGDEGRADSAPDVEELGRDQTIDFPSGWTPHALVAAAPGLVADPLPLRVGERHAFRLQPGGFLRILRGVRPPEGVDLRVRRKDGLPFRSDVAAFGKPGTMADAALEAPAVVVGPFVPGDVELVAVVGTTVIAEFVAHVVAGETTDVRVPLAERLPNR